MREESEDIRALTRERDALRRRVARLESECRALADASTLASEERLRTVVDNAPIVLWSADRDGIFTLSDGRGLVKLGLDPGEVVGQSLYEIYRDYPEITSAVRRAIAGESLSNTVAVGDLFFDCWYEPLRCADGRVSGMLGVAIDITDRTVIEATLREREAELEQVVLKQKRLLEQGWDVIVMLNAVGEIVFVSESTEHVLGYGPEDVVGRPVSAFVVDADVASVREAFKGIIDRPIGPGTIEARVKHKDGSPRWMEIRGTNFLADDAVQAIVVNCRDITERKATEEELVRLERLRALGQMSAGVSHNLNNILTGVLAPAEMLRMRTRDPEDLRDIQDILSSATRARDLISRLHQAVRSEAETFRPVDLNEGVREAVRVARPRWRDEPEARGLAIDLVLDLGEDAWIRGTRSGLQDIVINLLFNAVDAMPEGGTIRISTRPTSRGARMLVEDTGIGMSAATRSRVFEPFFTTKSGVGTGLGLSTVFGTVGRWGGRVAVDSEPGEGARFTFDFRGWEGELPPEDTVSDAKPAGRVLIVDHDETVCALLKGLLDGACDVSVATTADAALSRARTEGFDAVLVDLDVPGTSGDRLVASMRADDPALATVLMAGWAASEAAVRNDGFDFRIKKPFEDLAEVKTVAERAVELCRMRRETRRP